ncbi:hypothetical protein Fmac_029414 [Flemingia macrophylla]|uniref:SET domain-containing protein n=1 Tax=Flemingia macrophylla TaxID=520843 RepID=A0ABD1LA88_9FABA
MILRSRSQRKKGKPKKFNYSRKSAGIPPRLRKIAYGENQFNKQYTPCGCHGMCGKECVLSYAIIGSEDVIVLRVGVEVDFAHALQPIVNVILMYVEIVGSGDDVEVELNPQLNDLANAEQNDSDDGLADGSARDGVLSDQRLQSELQGGDLISVVPTHNREPPRRGDGHCQNMNILLGKKQRVDVAGWGAFTKNPINKNACLGEYTGELLTQKEADKRGKLYHRDHRVGIFAKENLEAGEEIFYDYSYALEHAPTWALPSKVEASKKHGSTSSRGKAKKYHSR